MNLRIKGGRSCFYQWDSGQAVIVEHEGTIHEVHFAHKDDERSLTVITKEIENGVEANVPNILLQSSEDIFAYLVFRDQDGTETRKAVRIPVLSRPKPETYVYTESEVLNYAYLDERLKDLEGEGLANALADYLKENPIEAGATAEEAAQIEQNKADIERLGKEKLDADKLPEAVSDALAQAKASGEFKGEPGNDYVLTEADKQEIADMVEVPEGGTVTDEQIASAVEDYFEEHPQSMTTLASPDGTVWNITVSNDGVITATKAGGNGDDEEVVVFTPFKFIQVSDTHYQYSQDATAVLVANVNALDDVDFVTNSGDLTLTSPATDEEKRIEMAEYKANLRDMLDVEMYPCFGNHDNCPSKAEVWQEYTGIHLLYELVHKDCAFLFVDSQSTGWVDWLEEKVAENMGKRIFVYEHYPIETDDFTVGLKEGETRGTLADADMPRVLRLLRNNHNIIWFTGHTHWPFGTAVNDVYNDNGLMGTIVHTPYLNAYQGWEVNVNDEATILKGVSFAEGGMSYLGNGYDYTIEQDITDYGEAEILTEGGTVEVGGETEISVYLATVPKGNQIVNVTTDDIISANVTSLTFTPQNYNVPQKVKVTGNSAGTGRLVLYSNSKTTVRKVDSVAGSATINYFNKNKPLTPLGIYYGTGTSASYQLSNFIPAKTGDHVRSTDLGSTTAYRLKMFDADFNYIAEAVNGVGSIDYTITEANVEYVSVVYRGATAGQADSIMVTVNQDLPSAYIAYNAESVEYLLHNYADAENPSLTDGYYNSSFATMPASGQNISNLIPCVNGDVFWFNNKPTSNAYAYLYDVSKTLTERVTIAAKETSATIENESAAYFAVGYNNSATDLMIMKNQKVPGYYVADTDTM